MGIKLRTIHADELRFAAYRHAARAAHTCAVHHDGVQTGFSRNIVFLGGQCHKLHHDSRTDSDALVHFLALYHLLHAHGHQSLLSQRTIVGHNDQFIRHRSQLFAQNDEFCCAGCQHGDNAVACLLEGACDRQHRCCTYATASTDHCAEWLDGGSFAQWTYQVCHFIACLECHQLGTTHAYALYHQRDGAAFRVRICNSEWHTFAMFVHAHHHKVTCATTIRNQRSL